MSQPSGPWRSRGYLPHYEGGTTVQFVTFRLADSLPARVLEAWRADLTAREVDPAGDAARVTRRRRIQASLDAGHGACWLRDARIAAITQETLLHFDKKRYRLLSWVIMPNHVHLLVQPGQHERIAEIIRSWKNFSALRSNKLLSRQGRFWQPDYFDRFIRDQKHHDRVTAYIEANPCQAGLCKNPEDWRWSSAWRRLGSPEP